MSLCGCTCRVTSVVDTAKMLISVCKLGEQLPPLNPEEARPSTSSGKKYEYIQYRLGPTVAIHIYLELCIFVTGQVAVVFNRRQHEESTPWCRLIPPRPSFFFFLCSASCLPPSALQDPGDARGEHDQETDAALPGGDGGQPRGQQRVHAIPCSVGRA